MLSLTPINQDELYTNRTMDFSKQIDTRYEGGDREYLVWGPCINYVMQNSAFSNRPPCNAFNLF